MTDTTIKIPEPLARLLDMITEKDPQFNNRSELARFILWEHVKMKSGLRIVGKTTQFTEELREEAIRILEAKEK